MSASLVSPVFVGRQPERALLADALLRSVDGLPQFVVVGGEAGVGKSRLLAELTADAGASGFRRLTGHCVQLGGDALPFAPLVDALRQLTRTMPPDELDRALGPARTALRRLLPTIEGEPDAVPAGPSGQGAQLFELVLGLVERLAATSPVLLVVEDLHWADQGTLDLLAHLARALRSGQVTIVGTYRSDELSRRHPLRSLLLTWEQGRSVQRLELARFGRDEVAGQVSAILGREPDASVADTVFDRSEGNPFLVEEVLGVLLAGGDAQALPQSLRDVLLSRVDAVGPQAQRLLSTAAVGGRWVSEELLLSVSGLDEAAAFDGLREAVEQHLLVVDDAGRGYSFRHALARDAVYDDLLPGERGRLHAAYGAALTARPELAGDDRSALAADLAHHWYAALDLPRALCASIEAADLALARFAPAEALRQLDRARQIWPRVPDVESLTGIDQVELLMRCTQIASDVGEVQHTSDLVDEALAVLGEDGPPERRALLLERRGTALHQAGRTEESIDVLLRAIDLLSADNPTRTRARVLVELATAMWRTGRWDDAAEYAEQAAGAAASSDAPAEQAEAEIVSAVVRTMQGDLDGTVELGLSAIARARDLGHLPAALRGYVNLSHALERLGRSVDAIDLAHEGRMLAERTGHGRSHGAFLAANEAESLTRLGCYDQAEALLAATIAAQPEAVFAASVLHVHAQLAVRQGRLDVARADVVRAGAVMGDAGELQFARSLVVTEVQLLLAEHQESAALDLLRAELTGLVGVDFYDWDWVLTWLALRTHADLAQQARDRGRPTPALPDEVAAALTRHTAETAETAVQRAYLAMCAAESTRAADHRDPAPWQAAGQDWRALDRPHELAECRWRAAEVHALNRDRAAAQVAAAEAFAVASAIGARLLVDEIAQLARQARLELEDSGDGQRLGSERPSAEPVRLDELSRLGLTPREREVLLMVADGRTNAEIGQHLFISPKTASVHVSNILAKLGVSSRVEAATTAYRLGLAADHAAE